MNDLLSVKGKEITTYEKGDLKKYIIYLLLGFKKYKKTNSKVNNIYNNINNNFRKYFNIDTIINQIIVDFHRGIGFTYNDISIIFFDTITKEEIINFKNTLNNDNKISKKILNFVNTFIDFVLEDNKNIDKYIENISKNNLLILNTIFVQEFYTILSIKVDYVNEFITNNFKSIHFYISRDYLESSNIPPFNYIIKDNKIILEVNYFLNFMKNSNDSTFRKIPFKINAELNIDSNEITIKFKSIINKKNDLDMLYIFNSIYFYMEINEKYKDDQFKVEMLEYLIKIYNDNKSFKLIYNLLKNIKTESDIKIILNIIKNKLNNKFINKIPVKRDETKQNYEKDFLLINFNEEKKSFNDNDCMSMLIKILLEEPSFIIVFTQDCKTGGKEHYQHLLGERLKENGYNLLVKNTINTLRMRIYYNTKKVKFNEKEKLWLLSRLLTKKGGDKPQRILKSTIVEKKYDNVSKNLIKENLSKSSNNSKNLEKDIFLVKKYGIKESKDKKYGNGLIFMRLEISKNNSFTKFIFVNCDLSLKDKDDQLENIINDFKLLYYWRKEYNIFFCGNFNIFEPFLNLIKPENFIKDYSTNISINKKKSSEKIIIIDKLSTFLKNKVESSITKTNNKIIPTLLLESIKKLGIHPTYKYIKDQSNKQVDFYNDIIYYTNKLKDINIDKENRYIIKFLNIPNLLESIKNNKNLVYEYFNIYIQLKFLLIQPKYKTLNGKKVYNNLNYEKIKSYILNSKEKNFINQKIFNLLKKYNINDKNIKQLKNMINFSEAEAVNKQKNQNEQKKIINKYINNFIKNKSSFNKVKNNIEKYIQDKDIDKLNKECEKFIKKLITNGLLTEDENNNIIIEKKRDDLLEQYNKIFNTEDNKIISYQPNRILYALSNHIISDSFDFEVYLFPDKSSHKLTTLSFKIYDKDNIISNQDNRSSITAIKGNNNNKKIAFRLKFSGIPINNQKTLEENQDNSNENQRINKITPIVGKNISSSNTSIIPPKIVSNTIKKIEKKENKNKQ
jgi:hypothetical protein